MKVTKFLFIFVFYFCFSAVMLFASGATPESMAVSTTAPGELPIFEQPVTMSVFFNLSPNMRRQYTELYPGETGTTADVGSIKELAKRTGIDLEFIHPPADEFQQSFNLMLASGDYADLIVLGWGQTSFFKGGVPGAIGDGVIVDVTSMVDTLAPNFKKEVLSNPNLARLFKDDNGVITHFGAGFIPENPDGYGDGYYGPMLRADLLEELDMEVPETVAEWDALLGAAKRRFPNKIPLMVSISGWSPLLSSNAFSGAYGTTWRGFFLDESGKTQFGPIQDGYKNLMQLMNNCYNKGYHDPDIATHTWGDHGWPAMLAGDFFATVTHIGYVRAYNQENSTEGVYIAAPFPVVTKGVNNNRFRHNYYGLTSNDGIFISTTNKYPNEAVRWIDNLYTTESLRLFVWGIEGVTYEVKNGQPELVDRLKDPQTFEKEWPKWRVDPFCYSVDQSYNKPVQYPYKEQMDAFDIWNGSATPSGNIPTALSLTAEEQEKIAEKLTEIETYTDEMLFKFMLGEEPIENFDKYVSRVKSMGIDELTAIYDKAVARYNAR